MVNCPVCDAVMDVEEDELDEGDEFTCDECGAEVAVVGTDPLEIEPLSDADEDEDEDDDDDLDEEDEEEEERRGRRRRGLEVAAWPFCHCRIFFVRSGAASQPKNRRARNRKRPSR